MKLALKYTLFAILATCVNIAAQDVSIRLYDQAYAVAVAVLIGTAAGLLVKYILDKKYIFNFRAQSLAHDSRTFMVYTLMGLATTVVFWGFEFGFDAVFQSKEMRYLGGVIGLAIGYLVKYRLDKHYVFGKTGA